MAQRATVENVARSWLVVSLSMSLTYFALIALNSTPVSCALLLCCFGLLGRCAYRLATFEPGAVDSQEPKVLRQPDPHQQLIKSPNAGDVLPAEAA